MGAVDPREADIVRHQEFAGRRAILGPGPHQFAVVVAVGALRLAIDDRPVGHIGEQQVDAVIQFLGVLDRGDGDETLGIRFPGHVAQLDRVTAAQRQERARMQHTPAKVEVLVHDQH